MKWAFLRNRSILFRWFDWQTSRHVFLVLRTIAIVIAILALRPHLLDQV
jgi:hypothetical protein